jgi:hypothetical protein
METQKPLTGVHPVLGNPNLPNPFADSGLFQNTADVWTPFKMSFEGFAGGGKTLTMCLIALALWEEEGRKKTVLLQDTERSAKFIVPFFREYGLIEGQNFFVTPSRSLIDFLNILELANKHRSIFMIDTVTHLHEEMLRQFSAEEKRAVKYPGDAMILKPMWKEKFATPFTEAQNSHILFTGRAAWEYTMSVNEETQKKEFGPHAVKMRGDNEIAYEPDVVVLMERMQDIGKEGVVTYRRASILKDRSRLIDGKSFEFWPQDPEPGKLWDYRPVWNCFKPVYQYLASGNAVEERKIPEPTPMGPLFARGNAEAFWERRRQVDALLEEIDGVYAQWIPGSGGMEKQLRSIIFNVQFNTRSKSALAERSPDELKRGLDVVEYLSRYVAKNFEHVEKMYDKGEYENISEFISRKKTGWTRPVWSPRRWIRKRTRFRSLTYLVKPSRPPRRSTSRTAWSSPSRMPRRPRRATRTANERVAGSR